MQGRVVLVTGSAKGIGAEVARQLAQKGHVDWSELASGPTWARRARCWM